MPIRPPALDDRSFQDLVDEALARIPAHSPEYTNPRPGDPGRTLIELFAWLTDTLLYRANLVPERQRLTFLRLLGQPMRAAVAARGLVSVQLDEDAADAIDLRRLATVKGAADFETLDELTVLPITAEGYYKRPITPAEEAALGHDLLDALPSVYGLNGSGTAIAPRFYATTPVFAGGAALPGGFDLIGDTIDGSLWLALLARTPELVPAVKATLGGGTTPRLLNLGVQPSIEVPALFEELADKARVPHVWELATGRVLTGPRGGEPEYLALDPVRDSSVGLTRRGVLRLQLPSSAQLGALDNDVRNDVDAGLGDRPPRLDDARIARRLVTWLRLRPTQKLEKLRLSWVGVNAVEIDQRLTMTGRVVGASNGAADQELQLPGTSVEAATLAVEVEEAGRGYVAWAQIPDLALAGPDAAVYSLDAEAGTIRFGDGMRGRIPDPGARVRVAMMRAGGGGGGNLPAGQLKDITALELVSGARVNRTLKVVQSLATVGGQDAENLVDAERRIPGLLRHRDRAVTADDFKRLAAETPGALLGRVEVLPRFKPQQMRSEVPGVTSVMVLPYKPGLSAPNPRADRPLLEAVHTWLDERRPLAMEMYTIGCEYVPLAVSVGVTLRDGFPRDESLLAVKDALRRFLWPLVPGGQDGGGWPLGRSVRDRELEVVVAQVPGVSEVRGVNLFEKHGDAWAKVDLRSATGAIEIPLEPWQLPELLGVLVLADVDAPDDPTRIPNPFAEGAGAGVAIPVVPEVC